MLLPACSARFVGASVCCAARDAFFFFSLARTKSVAVPLLLVVHAFRKLDAEESHEPPVVGCCCAAPSRCNVSYASGNNSCACLDW